MSETDKSKPAEIIPSIAELRRKGYKCYITHWRLYNGDFSNYKPRFLKENYDRFLVLQKEISGEYRSPKGGRTKLSLVCPDGRTTEAVTTCSPLDAFCRKTANLIVVTRCLANLKDIPLKEIT